MRGNAFPLAAWLSILLISPAGVERLAWENGALRAQMELGGRFSSAAEPRAAAGTIGSAEWTWDRAGVLVRASGNAVWASPADWDVRRAVAADLTRDGALELALLVWRPFEPWKVDAFLPRGGRLNGFHDAGGRSCHILLVGWIRGEFRELWAGSPMAQPALDLFPADWNGDGLQELLTIEGDYAAPAAAVDAALWKWNGFGFTLEGRSDLRNGNYLVTVGADGGADAWTG